MDTQHTSTAGLPASPLDMAAQTRAFRMDALANVARDGFPRVSGQTVETLLHLGYIRPRRGRIPYEITDAGRETLAAHQAVIR